MECLKRFGDTRFLLHAEDHIVLRLESPWPRDVALPEGWSLGEDRTSLVTNQRSLVAAKSKLPRRVRISGAVFAACAPFQSSDRYASAASELLRDADEICVVHNRDKVYRLVRLFPNASVLALPHDLCMHVVEMDEPSRDISVPLVERCQLTQLLGSVESLKDLLILSPRTLMLIMKTCPRLSRIDTEGVLDAVFLWSTFLPAPTTYQRGEQFTHLQLFPVFATDGTLTRPMDAFHISLAARTFPRIEILKVYVNSLEALASISAFRHLRSLQMSLRGPLNLADLGSELQLLLRRWPRLEELALDCCVGLRLSTIASLCPNLRSLRLILCATSTQDAPVEAGAFPNLECVELCVPALAVAFGALLLAARDTLRTVRLHDDDICGVLKFARRHGGDVRFPRLEDLFLKTEWSVRALGIQPEDLHSVVRALPALRHLDTDSYDLRLFFENYYLPLGRVSVSWTECAYCAVEAVNVPKRADIDALVSHPVPHLR
ncbi:LOW QUALITY PROTEIN: uncharacterized protein LOC119464952 [Dermacentor silvarum]|uniref:LOW QUALITY PROTEIN: uncharacterized protein LOC119464952 n=1 Tax=Dermacentor silvarum TaxID=543639 RepID=UPI002100CD14|nr:LOW QUALITY PROTEIN: uncharacterized protein LOC119464952 [Dermacentor silvarum]